ncbi:MAG: hypothetical protein HOP16_17680 [Acidobacteria bacterium]|nr:hypothetical protein [Acidobacteriota bacterium]
MKNAAIIEALSGLSTENALALEPVLRRMAHDLNGAMTPLTLEASALDELAQRLARTGGDALPAAVSATEIRETLEEASGHLRSTAARVSGYLTDARRVLERRGDVT